MIIFNLENVLANCDHRMHFVDPSKHFDYEYTNYFTKTGKINYYEIARWQHKETGEKFKLDWKSFYEACEGDSVIEPGLSAFGRYWIGENPCYVKIWTGRCESQREKTVEWLQKNWFLGLYSHEVDLLRSIIKMRPIGDTTPEHELKERWLDEMIQKSCDDASKGIKNYHKGVNEIDFIFESDPQSILMFRKRGIFVFDCRQNKKEI